MVNVRVMAIAGCLFGLRWALRPELELGLWLNLSLRLQPGLVLRTGRREDDVLKTRPREIFPVQAGLSGLGLQLRIGRGLSSMAKSALGVRIRAKFGVEDQRSLACLYS